MTMYSAAIFSVCTISFLGLCSLFDVLLCCCMPIQVQLTLPEYHQVYHSGAKKGKVEGNKTGMTDLYWYSVV